MVSAVRITPILLPAFNTPLANELSFLGNHSEVVFIADGKLVDSPRPSNARTNFKLKNDLFKNWLCDKWRLSLIDAERIPDNTTQHPMTTNNFTEHLHRTIETQYNGIQTVVNFVERLYGIKLKRENIGKETGEANFEVGLFILFNA